MGIWMITFWVMTITIAAPIPPNLGIINKLLVKLKINANTPKINRKRNSPLLIMILTTGLNIMLSQTPRLKIIKIGNDFS